MNRDRQVAAVDRAATRQARRLALGLGLLYAVLGVGWILASDHAVGALFPDPQALEQAQRFKGIAYVAVTALLLSGLVYGGLRRLLRSQADAQSRELQVRDLFERHPQPMWVHDAETGAVLTVNRAACRRYGRTEAEFVRTTVDALARSDEAATAVGAVCHATRAGERFYVRLKTHELPYHGRPAVLTMVEEVTQQFVAERRLLRQERRMHQLHQSLGEVLWLASADGRDIHYVSPALESVYGRAPADLQADPSLWLSCVHPEDRPVAEASMHALLAVGRSACEYRIVRPDGSLRWIADRKRLILDDEGHAAMIGGIGEDITAAKERDAALATTNAELERRVALRTIELERANAELLHANAELEAFARTAAHDLKSPLAGIAGLAALLRMRHGGALSVDGIGMVERIESSARQMADLVGDLLALSRATRGVLESRDVDLAAIARETLAELRSQHPERRVAFEAPAALWAHCDPGLARSLLANLLGNAWKFSAGRETATIRLRAETDGGELRVSIEDDGIGFDPAQAGRLFQPFERLHAGGPFAGTGVGLATCRRIVARHGGRIWAESEPGRGAVFRFTLPAPVREHAAA